MAYLLIIDDDDDFAAAIAVALTRVGHETHIEPHPCGALAAMGMRKPDLLIVDIMFPGDASGGCRLIQHIRHDRDDLSDIPILIVTAVDTDEPLGFVAPPPTEHQAATDRLQKPVDLAVLADKVAQLLGHAPP
jgi:CheY-like chemotaxis protein